MAKIGISKRKKPKVVSSRSERKQSLTCCSTKKERIDPKVNWLRVRKQPATSNILLGRNVFTLIYTCFVGTFFPFVNLRCLRRIIDIVLHFCCASFIEPSHKWRHPYRDRVSRSSDTWLFIILTQIINGSNVPTERNSIWTNKVNICTRSSTNRPIN